MSDQYETVEAQDESRAVVERLLRRLDRRERRIIVNRNGIGGVPEQTLKQISLDLGISKERVRQLEEGAHAKLRSSPASRRSSRRSCDAGHEFDRTWDSRPRLSG